MKNKDELQTQRKKTGGENLNETNNNFFPMPDAAHIRAAILFFGYAPDGEKPQFARDILQNAQKLGVPIKNTQILRWAEM